MPYTPPAHGAVTFNFAGSYAAPAHGSVRFNFGVVPAPPPPSNASPTGIRMARTAEEDWQWLGPKRAANPVAAVLRAQVSLTILW